MAAQITEQASRAWHIWQNQQRLFTPREAVDIQVPALVRQVQPPRRVVQLPEGHLSRAEAEKALKTANKAAEAAVLRAARLAALAGLDYQPPEAVSVDLYGIPDKVDGASLEQQAAAVEQARVLRQQQQARLQAQQEAAERAAASSAAVTTHSRHQAEAGRAHDTSGSQPYAWQDVQQCEGHWGAHAGQPGTSETQPGSQGGQEAARHASAADGPDRNEPGWLGQGKLGKPKSGAANQSLKRSGLKDHQQLGTNKAAQHAQKKQATGSLQSGPANSAGSPDGAEAWEDAPDRKLHLKVKDIRLSLKGKWLQLYWPDDNRWWPGQVLDVNVKNRNLHMLYETGEEEQDMDLMELIKNNEVAWLHSEDAYHEERTQHKQQQPPQQQGGASKKRKEAGESREPAQHLYAASPAAPRAAASWPHPGLHGSQMDGSARSHLLPGGSMAGDMAGSAGLGQGRAEAQQWQAHAQQQDMQFGYGPQWQGQAAASLPSVNLLQQHGLDGLAGAYPSWPIHGWGQGGGQRPGGV